MSKKHWKVVDVISMTLAVLAIIGGGYMVESGDDGMIPDLVGAVIVGAGIATLFPASRRYLSKIVDALQGLPNKDD